MSGKLIISGGNLEYSNDEVQKHLIEYAGGLNSKMVIIATASGEPDYSLNYIEESWNKLGLDSKNIVKLPIFRDTVKNQGTEPCGDNEEFFQMIQGATGFWFTGGDQYYINRAFMRADGTDTKILQYIREVVKNGGVVGGSSAGAAMMSEVMIASGHNISALTMDVLYGYDDYDDEAEIENLRITQGLGFFKDGIIDQHFDVRSRIVRLIRTVMDENNGFNIGYGIAEDTSMIYDVESNDIEIIGLSGLYIVDCENTKNKGTSYSDVRFHVLQKGDKFNTKTKKINFRG